MAKISASLQFILDISRLHMVTNRKLDGHLGLHGLGLNDFIVLYHLTQAVEGKLRRIDLAEKMGLTASAITRMLLPMEKIGLVSREANAHDARSSYVVLAPGGKRLFEESLKTAQYAAKDIISSSASKKIEKVVETLHELAEAL